jgi:GNAT superfamily N-acetyltransferase
MNIFPKTSDNDQAICYDNYVFALRTIAANRKGVEVLLQTILVSLKDEPFLFQVFASVRTEELISWGMDEATQQTFLRMQWTAQQRSYALQFPEADHRILLYRDEPAGRIMVNRTESEVLLVDLSLLPAFQNKGIGTHLIEDLQKEAAGTGRTMRLHVLNSNPARFLYKRLGFTVTGSDGVYDSMSWSPATGTTGAKNIWGG